MAKRFLARGWQALLWMTVLASALSLASLVMIACQEAAQPDAAPPEPLVQASLNGDTDTPHSLRNGQAHEFPVALRQNDALRVIAEQQGVDVTLTLFDRHGDVVAEMDSPNGRGGFETLAVVARDGGDYRLQVNAIDGEGSYRLRVERLDTARAEDQAWAEAVALYTAVTAPGPVEGLEETLERALALVETLEAPQLEARFRRIRANRWLQHGHQAKAIAELETAAGLLDRHGTALELAPLLKSLGGTLILQDQLAQAEETLRWGLALAEETGQDSVRAAVTNDLGLLHHMRGEWQQAFDHYHRALELGRIRPNLAELAIWRYNLGILYEYLGRRREARTQLEQALDIQRTRNDPTRICRVLAALAWIDQEDGHTAGAEQRLDEALTIARRENDRSQVSQLLEQHAFHLLLEDQPESAAQGFQQALELLDTSQGLSRAYLLTGLGTARVDQGRAAEAIPPLEAARDTFREMQIVQGQITAGVQLARAERQQQRLGAAVAHLEEAAALVEDLRQSLGGSEFRRAFFASRADLFDLQIEILMEQGRIRDAFTVTERARARGLLDLLGGLDRHGQADRSADPEEHDAQQLLRRIRQLEENRQLHLEAGNFDVAAAFAERLEGAVARFQESANRAETPFTERRSAPPLDIDRVQSTVLDGQTRLVAYHLGESRSWAWIVRRESTEAFELVPRTTIETSARRVSELLVDKRSDPEALQEALDTLSQHVLKPIAGSLNRDPGRLLIVADGALQAIPFAALNFSAGGPALLDTESLVYLPSASAIARLRERRARRPRPARQLALIDDPVFERRDPRFGSGLAETNPNADRFGVLLKRLPFSGQEAEAIFAMVDPRTSVRQSGFAANLDLILSGALAEYRFIHLATHGRFQADLPSLSGLILSRYTESGQSRASRLSLLDIFRLDLTADLVVLSACETALGRHFRGDGMVAPSYAFFAAGASRLVASFWRVDDEATAFLMETLYRGLLIEDLSPPEALRRAQLAVRTEPRWSQPYFWAGFALNGEWRPLN